MGCDDTGSVIVGMTATIALTLNNPSGVAATDTHLELPLPHGVKLLQIDQSKPRDILTLTKPIRITEPPINVTRFPLPPVRDGDIAPPISSDDVTIIGQVRATSSGGVT